MLPVWHIRSGTRVRWQDAEGTVVAEGIIGQDVAFFPDDTIVTADREVTDELYFFDEGRVANRWPHPIILTFHNIDDRMWLLLTGEEQASGNYRIFPERGSYEEPTIHPEHNYHDMGGGALISEILGTVDGALGEYERG